VSRLLPHLLSPQGLPDAGSNIIVIDFAARLPPRLSRDDFVAFLDSLPPHPSSLLFLAKDGKVEEARRILEDNHSSLEVNWQEEEEGSSALHYACRCGHDSFVTILLAHPGIDVNLKDKRGGTPLFGAFYLGATSCIREMLGDSRVKINEPNIDGCTPLWDFVCNGHIDGIRWWIASGREIDLGKPGDKETDVILLATTEERTEVATLLKRFKSDANKTRSEVRMELGIDGQSVPLISILSSPTS